MNEWPTSLPLTGGDYFVLALDHQLRKAGLAGNVCQLQARLEGGLEPEKLRAALDRSPLARYLAGVRRGWNPPFGRPRWRAARQPGPWPVTERRIEGAAPAAAAAQPLDPRHPPALNAAPGAAWDIAQYDDACDVALTWRHALLDARGAELFFSGVSQPEWPPDTPPSRLLQPDPPERRYWLPRSLLRLPGRSRFARKSVLFITDISREPVAWLGPAPPGAGPPRSRYHVIRFDEADTRRIDEVTERSGAGFRRALYYLAAAARAFRALLRERGVDDGAIVAPMPQDARRRGFPGPAFGNHLTFFFYRVEPEEAVSLETTIATLKRQLERQLRDEIPRSYAEMMAIFRRLPLPLYTHLLRGSKDGPMASFFFSYAGECCGGLERFLDRPVRDFTHFAPVPCPPGLSVIFSRYRERLSAVVSWAEGCLNADDLALLEQTLRAELLGAPSDAEKV